MGSRKTPDPRQNGLPFGTDNDEPKATEDSPIAAQLQSLLRFIEKEGDYNSARKQLTVILQEAESTGLKYGDLDELMVSIRSAMQGIQSLGSLDKNQK